MLPDSSVARVDRTKVVDYLLSSSHPDGRAKAAFFTRCGFKVEEWEVLAQALQNVGMSHPVKGVVESAYGKRYTVDGPLQTPRGLTPKVRTVWIVEPGHPPRLVTACPI
jgi:hypothetical protein